MPRIRRIAVSKYAHDGYMSLIQRAGGTPVKVTERTLVSDFNKCHGLLIPGGRDVDPTWYNAKRHPMTQLGDLDRDHLEMTLIRLALQKDMPVLGVCRGHQILNVTMGGTLIQHIKGHEGYSHPVSFFDSKLLSFIEEKDKGILFVNSLHHQALGKIGKDLKPVAISHDNIIEAVEGTNNTWVVGVQWHPEINHVDKFNAAMSQMVDRFVHAKKGRAR